MNNLKIVVVVVVSVVATLFLLLMAVSYFGESTVEDIHKQQASFELKQLEGEQARLGVSCKDGDIVILNYLDAIAPIAGKLNDGRQLSATNPIHELGEHAADVMDTCSLFRGMLEEHGDHTLNGLRLGEKNVRQEFVLIRLSVARTSASWCNAACILDAKKTIDENAVRLRQRLIARESKPMGSAL